VSCPALPGCQSQRDDVGEALKNIKEAIVGCLESPAEERTRLFWKDRRSNGLTNDVPKAAGDLRQGSYQSPCRSGSYLDRTSERPIALKKLDKRLGGINQDPLDALEMFVVRP